MDIHSCALNEPVRLAEIDSATAPPYCRTPRNGRVGPQSFAGVAGVLVRQNRETSEYVPGLSGRGRLAPPVRRACASADPVPGTGVAPSPADHGSAAVGVCPFVVTNNPGYGFVTRVTVTRSVWFCYRRSGCG